MTTSIHEAFNLGQSIWLDYISRDLIASGGLQDWINKGVVGVTTNPSIFENAIAKTKDYDEEIASLMKQLKENGSYTVSDSMLSALQNDFRAANPSP